MGQLRERIVDGGEKLVEHSHVLHGVQGGWLHGGDIRNSPAVVVHRCISVSFLYDRSGIQFGRSLLPFLLAGRHGFVSADPAGAVIVSARVLLPRRAFHCGSHLGLRFLSFLRLLPLLFPFLLAVLFLVHPTHRRRVRRLVVAFLSAHFRGHVRARLVRNRLRIFRRPSTLIIRRLRHPPFLT